MTRIVGYRVIERLYEGNKTFVCRGQREQDQFSVILKILRQDHPTPHTITRFKLEYDITRQLNLDSTVKAYCLETYQHRLVMVLEDFGGMSLNQLLKTRKFSLEEILKIGIQTAGALGQIHDRHIIHKDINPANIVLNLATQQLKIIDFGIATRLSQETPIACSPYTLEGTLAYLSPEQTGRMNRSLDYRTDFYSLGVMLYELLTDQRPFRSTDLMELVHAHLARPPVPPHEVNSAIPLAVSQIVMKLMAKMAEDRYQSAIGIQTDLENCLHQWQQTGHITSFLVGVHDHSTELRIPQKLYGRDQEIATLLNAFQQMVTTGQQQLFVISGKAGVGKSALVQELYKSITQQRGYFITGKFDQYQQNVPYSAVISAFVDLIQQLLSEPSEQLHRWQEQLLAALGNQGQVLIEFIPELERLIGKQPEVPSLTANASQARFNRIFFQFTTVFTHSEHPLVLFLDDLQWADDASLKLIHLLITELNYQPDRQCLFIIGAYRDDEVGTTHLLSFILREIQNCGAIVHSSSLTALKFEPINQLIADTLRQDPAATAPLANLVLTKTDGNPFFVNEFLKQLQAENLLYFNPEQRCWQWDSINIQAKNVTSNVVNLLIAKIQQLPSLAQTTLPLVACIGNNFELSTLSLIQNRSPSIAATALQDAILAGLIFPLNMPCHLVQLAENRLDEDASTNAMGMDMSNTEIRYQFVHDRIQQAAYSLIPETERKTVHYQIGQLLLHRATPEQQDRLLFEIVHHYNTAYALIQTSTERREIAHLNLLASQKAKASAAYESAFSYLQAGLNLLEADRWQQYYDLTLALYQSAVEAAYLTGRFEQMDTWAEEVMHHAREPIDRVAVYETKIQAFAARTQFLQALQMALQALGELGVELPDQPAPKEIQLALRETMALLEGRSISELIDLPQMHQPHSLAVMKLLSSAISPAYIAAPNVLPLIVFQQVAWSVTDGNALSSPFAYAMYGLILCGVVLDIETGYSFGTLALQLLDQLNAKSLQAKTFVVVYTNVQVWKQHLRTTLQPLQEAHQAGLDNGDLEFAGYAAANRCYYSFYCGQDLPTLQKDLQNYIQVLTHLKQFRNVDALEMYLQVVLNLTEKSQQPDRLIGEVFDENIRLPKLQQNNDRHALFHIYLHKLVLSYLFQQYSNAATLTNFAEQYLDGVVSLALVVTYYFYDSLTRIAIYPNASSSEQTLLLERITVNQNKLRHWADHAPMNYLHKWYLVEAERYRILHQEAEAVQAYDRAIALAQEHEYIQEAALACELAYEFYFMEGRTIVAKAYFQEARYHYLRWGGTTKVKALEAQHSEWVEYLPEQMRIASDSSSSSSTSETLDLVTVMKASQAISRELVLDRLLTMLLQVAIENAGAQTGYLVLQVEGTLYIEARRSTDDETTDLLYASRLDESQLISTAIVHYVARTQESVVLSNAAQSSRFAFDPYIQQQQPKSILCTPLVNQSKLIGVLYLENNIIANAFKPERVRLLTVLSTQMAISIENARLLKQQEELNNSLQGERKQIGQILERITDGFIAVDRTLTIIYVNQQADQHLGKSIQDSVGRSLWDEYPPDICTTFCQKIHEAIETRSPTNFEEFCALLDRWFEVNAYPDHDGLSIFFRDITARKQMEERLVHDALHDALTGLPNRLLLTEKLEQAIDRVKQDNHYRFAVLFLDIDRFKVINDSLGHLVGDQLLVAIARRLEHCISEEDSIARLGGDEFIILLNNSSDEARVAARIQMALNVPFDLNGYKVFNTVSIGIVSSTTGYDRPDDLLRAADIAMYQAKAAGKARYVVFDSTMHEQATSLLKLETDLRWAIERQELRVYYQPILCLETNRLIGFEALVRWIHPDQGVISPSKFIPLAEETGLILPIGQWVLQEACRQLRIWQLRFSQAHSLTMSVNLSVKQFSQADLIQRIDRTLQNMDLRGEHLKLEITESALMNNPEVTRELLMELRSRQIQLCIDDFGTGYSSLNYLHQFPIDILKIDQSFVRYMSVKNEDSEIVRTIMSLAQNLTVEVIAEGIETHEQLTKLKQLGCRYGQGFLFAKPLDSTASETLIGSQLK
ncbi:hypothetical protein C7B76_24775 [filamentous cyanobacterium CCP2]|nr:hypothetical protein C7B76_24775 [filamentous cyanobacterium CCP2]